MITRLFDIVEHQLSNHPKEIAIATKVNGQWVPCSSASLKEQVDEVSCGLFSLGINKDDKVAIIAYNRTEWNIVDFGVQQTGAVLVPVYPTISASEFQFILKDSESKIVFVSDKDLFDKISSIKNQLPVLKTIFAFDNINGAPHWSEVRDTGRKNFDASKLKSSKDSVKTQDLATILYTSGTTGNPKGVMLTHSNLISNLIAVEHLPPVDSQHKALSFLPLCHVYERILTYLYMYLGVSIYYAESIEKIGDNIREVKPHVFSCVPRLLEKVYDKIIAKGREQKGIKRALFFWANDLGLRYEINRANGWWYELQLSIANKLIFSKWREALGGNTKVMISGGAALQPRLARVFWAAKIPVLEGYGLTETSPIIAVNNFEQDGLCFGTVGTVIKNVEVKIAEDGEILCKGPNVMKGYFKRPDLTEQVIDKEGWFHTGDIGEFVQNRFLKITDRKKEIFKTSGGKYIAPQMIENKLKESPFIEQAMVIGENQKFAAALIVPAFAHIKNWCVSKNIAFTTNGEMIKNPEIVNRISEEITMLNESLGKTEQIKKFELLPKEWTLESGELTATQKLKRKILMANNNTLVNKIYSDNGK
ncbi:MAG TPA: long-chain fatty acid--CoA ligase [Bacteroidia bacterium]|nr:long-chain fatty acid--CoA ligase [Bacteroidia bacterium]